MSNRNHQKTFRKYFSLLSRCHDNDYIKVYQLMNVMSGDPQGFAIQVEWKDGVIIRVYRSYGDMLNLQVNSYGKPLQCFLYRIHLNALLVLGYVNL